MRGEAGALPAPAAPICRLQPGRSRPECGNSRRRDSGSGGWPVSYSNAIRTKFLCPDGTRLFEVDTATPLDFKASALRRERAAARCERTTVAGIVELLLARISAQWTAGSQMGLT